MNENRFSNLTRKLRTTGRWTLLAETARAAGLVIAGLFCLALLATALDAILALTPWGLITVDVLAASLLLAGIIYVAWVGYCNSYNVRRVARLIETRLRINDSSLINAVDLCAMPEPALGLAQGGLSLSKPAASPELAAAAVEEGDARAAGVDPLRVIDGRALGKGVLAFALASGLMIASYLALPDVFRAVLPRYLHPSGNLPPFTLIKFDVTVQPEKVYFGRPASIWARLSGPNAPDQADVVFTDGGALLDGQTRVPMVRSEFFGKEGRFVMQIERAERTRDFYIYTASGRSRKYQLVVHPVPQFEQVTVRYEFPSYTNWPAKMTPLDASGIAALADTQVTVTIKSNLPLSSGLIELFPAKKPAAEQNEAGAPSGAEASSLPSSAPSPAAANVNRVPMQPQADNPHVAVGKFPLTFSGRYRMSLTGADGTPSHEALEGTVTCIEDAMPKVRIVEPTGLTVAPEDWKVPVAVTADDDVAVTGITLSRGANGWGPTAEELKIKPSGPAFATANYEFDLPALGVRAGDVISFFATAYDNHPGAAHFADTETAVIRVISKEEYLSYARTKYRMDQVMAEVEEFRNRLQQLDAQREALLKDFQELQEKIQQQGGKLTEADKKRLDELDARHGKYADDAKALAQEMFRRAAQPKIYDFEEQYNQMLREEGEKLMDQSDSTGKLRDVLSGMRGRNSVAQEGARYVDLAVEQLRKDEEKDQQVREQVETAQEQLERLRQADRMIALTERIMAVAKQQRELADRMGQFRNKESLSPTEQIRARRLADDQGQLQRDLQETLDELQQQADQSKDVLPKMSGGARKIVQSIRDLDVQGDQQDAARLAQAGQGRYAHQSAESAAQKLESLIKECNGTTGMMQYAGEDCELELKKMNITQSLSQLAQGRGIPGLGGGGEGGGYYGSRTRIGLVGPHSSGGDSDAQSGLGATGRGPGSGGRTPGESKPPELLKVGQPTTRSASAGGMPGVPVKYRDLAEAYFRRLADESK